MKSKPELEAGPGRRKLDATGFRFVAGCVESGVLVTVEDTVHPVEFFSVLAFSTAQLLGSADYRFRIRPDSNHFQDARAKV